MRLEILIRVAACLLLSMALGCGVVVPRKTVWRPWNRIFQSDGEIRIGATLTTSVSGECSPLLGEQSLFDVNVKEALDQLLSRRGYRVVDTSASFTLDVVYRTEKVDKLNMSTSQYSYSYQSSSTTAKSGSGSKALSGRGYSGAAGIAIASSVARLIAGSAQQLSQTITTTTGYSHTFSLEMRNVGQELTWKAETVWESSSVDPRNDLYAVLQIMISDLPADSRIVTRTPKLKESHRDNYMFENCSDRWFSCPALPYRIYFPVVEFKSEDGLVFVELDFVKNPEALPAFVDLAKTAEYALPMGSKDYDNPVDLNLWKRVALGGTYYLGNSDRPQRVFVKLKGQPSGYAVEECWIGTEEEFTSFSKALSRWKESVGEYYDMFED